MVPVMGTISLVFSAMVFIQTIAGIGDLASLAILLVIAGGYFAGRRAGVKLIADAIRRHGLAGPVE